MTMTQTNKRPGVSGTPRLMDYQEAERMLRAGMTQAEVGAHFGLGQSAVAIAIKRGLIKFDTGRRRRLPWDGVKAGHHSLSIPRSLRYAVRIQEGDPTLTPQARALGEGFIRKLAEADAVIHYDPDVAPYWFRVPRRPGIDTGLWREPDK